jgi:hypothetical protein
MLGFLCTDVRYTAWPHRELGLERNCSILNEMVADSVERGSRDDSDNELLPLLSLCKRKKNWVHGVYLRRIKFGEFNHLIKQLRED